MLADSLQQFARLVVVVVVAAAADADLVRNSVRNLIYA